MNQTKNLANLMASLAVTAMLALVGCEDSSTDPDNSADDLIGVWNLTSSVTHYGTSIADADYSEDADLEIASMVLTINADGTGSYLTISYGDTYDIDWTYTATADEITITTPNDEGPDVDVIAYEISGNTLTLTTHREGYAEYDEPDRWTVNTFTKQ